MGSVTYKSLETIQKALHNTRYDEQLVVAKLDFVKLVAKRVLLDQSRYELTVAQINAICHALTKNEKNSNKNIVFAPRNIVTGQHSELRKIEKYCCSHRNL